MQSRVQQETVAALKSLANGSQQMKDAICAAGALPLLVQCLRSGHSGLIGQAAAALTCLTTGSQQNKDIIHAAGVVFALKALGYLELFRENERAALKLLQAGL